MGIVGVRMRRLVWVGAGFIIAAAAIWFNNTSLWIAPAAKSTLLAHRGLADLRHRGPHGDDMHGGADLSA
jgi:hypothetical protein